jgi:spore coat protein U-like protein
MHTQAPVLRPLRLLVAAVLASACGLSVGGTKTATFNVTASVLSNCFIDSASAMAFGTYSAGTQVDQQSTISVRCSAGTPYGIGLNAGTGTGSTVTQRQMSSVTAGAGSVLQFNLFTDSLRTVIWDNPSTAGSAPGNQSGVGAGLGLINAATHTVYGRLQDTATSQAALPAADYTSTITVTINY